MTVQQLLSRVDGLHPNRFSLEEKLHWLSRAEGQVVAEILSGHTPPPPSFSGYGVETPPDTPLLVPAPYDELYYHYIEAQMLYTNGEIAGYNNAMALYQQYFSRYYREYHTSHTPVGVGLSVMG